MAIEYLLLISAFLCAFIGLAGSVLPIIPGPLVSWVSLLLLYLTTSVQMKQETLIATGVVAIVIFIFDLIIPIVGTRIYGGSKYGNIGSAIGLIVGLIFLGPFGIIIGPFSGAFIGELYGKRNVDTSRAFMAALGSFIGFLAGTFVKILLCTTYLIIFFYFVIKYIF